MKFSERVSGAVAESDINKLQLRALISRFENIRSNMLFSDGVPIYFDEGQTENDGMNYFGLATGHMLYNARRKPNNGLEVDFKSGCALRYEQKHNGCVVCKIIGFDGIEYLFSTYSNPESIGAIRIRIHIKTFEAIFFCTSQRLIPSFFDKLVFLLIKARILARSMPAAAYLRGLMSAASKYLSWK